MPIPNVVWILPRPRRNRYKGGFPLHFEKKLVKFLNPSGPILHPFGGMAEYGIKVDITPEVKPDILADAHNLPLKDNTFGLVVCDPPYDAQQIPRSCFTAEAQVLTTAKEEKAKKVEGAELTPRKRAKITSGVTERVTTGCGYIYVTVNSDEQGICEVFSSLGKAGGCASAQLEATCRLISLALRSGVDVASAVKQLRGIRCPSIAWESGHAVLSCADAIASVLEKHIGGDNKPKLEDYGLAKNLAGQCPECGNLLVYQEGCFICPSCGYTKC